jgi:hypothetical protein
MAETANTNFNEITFMRDSPNDRPSDKKTLSTAELVPQLGKKVL